MPISRSAKTAYLTIDDGPSPLMAARVAFLAGHGIPAIWFCRGDYLEERPDAALAALHAGSILGNHTYDHSYCSKLSVTQFREQLERTDRIIDGLHTRAGVPRRAKLFRFPYEDRIDPPEHFAALQAELRDHGFVLPAFADVPYRYFNTDARRHDLSIFWTYDTRDWSLPDASDTRSPAVLAEILARMDQNDPEGTLGLNEPGAAEVIMMHDHGHTGSRWERIIEGLLAKGLRFALPSF